MTFRFAAIALAMCLSFAPSPAGAAQIDAIVAAIEHDAIARSTLEAYRQAYAAEQPPAVALQQLIDDHLLAREANRYGQTLTNEEVKAAIARVPRPGTLTQLEWEALAASHLLAQRFLDFRFGDFVPVSRDEIRAYYEAHRDRYPQALDAVEEAIRQLLVPVVRARRISVYKDELRVRYDVRINGFLLPAE
ncbi:MAG: hypothetical protein ACK46X_10385 [Candidatus Sericytochromatia bacterium]